MNPDAFSYYVGALGIACLVAYMIVCASLLGIWVRNRMRR